jgi:hypothetical protein
VSQPLALPIDPIVARCHEFLVDLQKLGSHAIGHRLSPEHEAAAIAPGCAIVREPEEIECLWFAETIQLIRFFPVPNASASSP